ncbi:MAG: DUF503 domain-containing protein [Candidatus Brocadiae bacterium]|nr:DUF503 domain-containing protein [Candidatus Brocadiia bacterium]
MIVGTVEIRLSLRDARTLKDKRSIISGLKDRVRKKFNVSVAEVGNQDIIQSATLAVAQVSNDSRYVNGSLDKVVEMVKRCPAARLVDYTIEIL